MKIPATRITEAMRLTRDAANGPPHHQQAGLAKMVKKYSAMAQTGLLKARRAKLTYRAHQSIR